MQEFLRFKKGPFLPLPFVNSFLNSLYERRILCAGPCKNKHFASFRIIRRPRVSRMMPGTSTMYQVFIGSRSSQPVPRSYCCTKRATPLESSHGHHLPTRAASAHTARGRCYDPKRVAAVPGCRACSASPEHRVGSLLIAGQDQTQAHSSSSTRSSSTIPDDGSHIHRILPP